MITRGVSRVSNSVRTASQISSGVRTFATPQSGPHMVSSQAPANNTKAAAVRHQAQRPGSALDKASELFFFTEILRGAWCLESVSATND